MGAVTNLLSSATTANAASYVSASFTPSANDLLLVYTGATATLNVPSLTDSQSLGFTLSTNSAFNSTAHMITLWVANALAAATAMTVTASYGADAATGHVFVVAGVSGISRTGLSAIKQVTGQRNQGAGASPPDPVFAAAMTSSNVGVGFVSNNSSASTGDLAAPSGWTEATRVEHATPSHHMAWAFINSGSTLTTITWGGSTSGFAVICAELDDSSTGVGGQSTYGSASADPGRHLLLMARFA